MPVSKKDRKARKKARGKLHPYGRDAMVEEKASDSEREVSKDVTRGQILQRYFYQFLYNNNILASKIV